MTEGLFEQAHKVLSEVTKGSSVPGYTERNFQELLRLVREIAERTDAREIRAASKTSALRKPEKTNEKRRSRYLGSVKSHIPRTSAGSMARRNTGSQST